MRRTTTRFALTVGAGAGAVLLTAGSAFASGVPDDWADRFTELSGYSGVTCLVSTIPGGQSSVFISEDQWSPLLRDNNEFVGIGLELEDGTIEHSPFLGYGEDHLYSSSSGEGIERAVVCQGDPAAAVQDPVDAQGPEVDATEGEGSDDVQDEADETDADTETEVGSDNDGDADADADEDADDQDQAAGPPVETDGPSTAGGVNPAVMGGAALALAGVGIAGFALRRRPQRS